VPPTRFTTEINRLRAALRGKHDAELLTTLRRELERLPVAALVADNSSRYVAANEAARMLTGYTQAELTSMSVMDLTPIPKTAAGRKLWETFVAQGGQRGEYELMPKSGGSVRVRYWAYASVAPGLHVSLLVPSAGATGADTVESV
jgi:PAS domain S-box-containing protein